MRCHTVVNAQRRLTRKRRNCWSYFCFLYTQKKYSCSFLKLSLNHWCHMDYFIDVLTTFWAFTFSVALVSMQGQKALWFHQKYLNLCSEDEQRCYRFGMIWVINDRISISGWTIPLKHCLCHLELWFVIYYKLQTIICDLLLYLHFL